MTGTLRELLAALRNIFTWWIVVAPWEQVIRVRLGKRVELLGAGVHLRIPFVDRAFRQSTRRRSTVLPVQTLRTLDGKQLTISGVLSYRIADLLLLYQTVHHAEGTIAADTTGAIGEFVAATTAEDCTPPALRARVGAAVGLERYGLAD